MSVSIDITVEAGDWNRIPGAEAAIERALHAVSDEFQSLKAEYSVLLTDDAHMRALNMTWRKLDKPTNVLSFPAPDETRAAQGLLGDIVLSLETVLREATEEGKAPLDHIAHLSVHGALHLFGLDHRDDAEAKIMERREREILARLGIADPYISSERKLAESA
jgi:probable rRNA maturation factor